MRIDSRAASLDLGSAAPAGGPRSTGGPAPGFGALDALARDDRAAALAFIAGPAPTASTVAPEVRKAVYARAATLLQTTKWVVLAPSGELGELRGAPALPSKALLRHFDAGLGELVRDPAKGNTVGAGSIEEAAIGLVARTGGVIAGPIRRDGTGLAEFIGRNDVKWDVKSPLSPSEGQTWRFDAQHQVVKIEHDLAQGNLVLLNLSRCSPTDTRAVLAAMHAGLAASDLSKIYILVNR